MFDSQWEEDHNSLDAAYVIVCLIEQNASFQRLGYPTAHNTAAKNAALAVVKQLCG